MNTFEIERIQAQFADWVKILVFNAYKKEQLNTLLEMLVCAILDDASLNYNKDGLMFDIDSKNTLAVLKYIEPERYKRKLDELKAAESGADE